MNSASSICSSDYSIFPSRIVCIVIFFKLEQSLVSRLVLDIFFLESSRISCLSYFVGYM